MYGRGHFQQVMIPFFCLVIDGNANDDSETASELIINRVDRLPRRRMSDQRKERATSLLLTPDKRLFA